MKNNTFLAFIRKIMIFFTILLISLPIHLFGQEDTTPPEVISVSPADGTTDVPVSIERVRIVFSEPMDRGTYSGNIKVVDSNGTGHGGCAYSGESVYEKVFCGQVLEPNSVYYVHVNTNVTDIAGNHLTEEFVSSFTTSEITPDTTPPEIISVSPADGTTDVPVSIERVRIVFSEPMDRGTYSGNIKVVDSNGTGHGGCAYSGESVYEKVFCGQVLEPNSVYYVHVNTNVTDIAGNHLTEEFVSSFTTSEITPDTTPPEIISVSPADGTTDVPASIERVRIVFSEPMDRGTYSGNIKVVDSNGTGHGGCAYSGESVYEKVFCGQVLEPNSAYYVHVNTNVTDIAGNHLTEEFVSSFTTESTNNLPIVYAGPNITISSENQTTTILLGTASDPDGDAINYRWLEGATELSSWQDVVDGKANLNLFYVPLFTTGQHTLSLEVSDGIDTVTDNMILTVDNSSPHAAPSGGGVYEVNNEVILGGSVSDFDGDTIDYEWMDGETLLDVGSIPCIKEGAPVQLPTYSTWNLSLGIHTITLIVNDGVNEPVSNEITVQIVDTGVPTLAPVCSELILWPPNHRLVDIYIIANASDDSGLPVTLDAEIFCNEPENSIDDGDMAPDWTQPIIDQDSGIISFQLRAERSGSGDGREYTIVISCTDSSGNSSTADVTVIVPHDKRK